MAASGGLGFLGGGLGGAVIGRAVVELVGDTAKLQKDVQMAQQKTEQSTSKMGASATRFGTVAKVAMGVAALAFVSFVAKGATSLQRIERINAQTAATIESTGGKANVTAAEVEALAGSIEDLTSVEAETVQEGANLLLTFVNVRNEVGKGNDIFNQAVGVMTDMSVALGQDMKSSAIQLGKALGDPIKGMTALRRVGVSFTQQQIDMVKEMIESNRILDAQKLILRELNVEFGGSAEALGETTAGKIQLFRHAVGTAQEALASALLPAMLEVAEAATDLVNALMPVFEVLSDILGVVLVLVGWAGKLLGAFDGLGVVVVLLGIALGKVAFQSLAASAGIASVATESGAATGRVGGFLGKLMGLTPASLAWAGATIAVGIALGKLSEFTQMSEEFGDKWAQQVQSGTTTLQELHAEVERQVGSVITPDDIELLQAWTKAAEDTEAAIKQQNQEILAGTGLYEEWGGALNDTTNQNMRLHASVAELVLALDMQGIKLNTTDEAMVKQKLVAGDLEGAIKILSTALGLGSGEQRELAAQTDEVADAMREQKAAQDALAGGLLGLLANIDGVQDAQANLNQLERDGKRGTEEYKDAKLALLQSQLQVNDGLKSYMEDLRASGRSQDFAVQKVIELGRQVGLTKQDVLNILGPLDRYKGKLDAIPDRVDTQVVTTFVTQREGGQGRYRDFHEGGRVHGAHGADVPIVAQAGEYVVRASAVRRVGTATLDRINRMHSGGPVQQPVPTHSGGGMAGWGGLSVHVDGKVETADDLRRTLDWWYRNRGL